MQQTTLRVRAATHVGVLLIALSAMLWGTVGVATRALYTISTTNALSIGFFRLAISSPALLLACWLAHRRAMFQSTRRNWTLIVLLGMLTALYQVCLFSAIQYIGVSIAIIVTLCAAPVFVALASTQLFREPITRWILLALGCAIGGTLLLSGGGAGLAATAGATATGVALALGSALGYSGTALIGRVLATRCHPLQTIAFGFSIGALVLLPFALAQGLVVSYSPLGWGLLLHMGLLPTALAYVLFLIGIRTVTATTASVITLVEPLTASLLAWQLFGEHLSSGALLGGVLLVGAILLLLYGEARRT